MSKEALIKMLRHETVTNQGAAPWVPFTGVHTGKLLGYDAVEMLTDIEKIVEGILEANRLYLPDGMPVLFDLQIEAEILGCELVWAKDSPPTVKTHPLAETMEIPCDCTIPDKDEGRLPIVLSVMERIKKEIGENVALYGLVCGPFTLASHLRGNNIFMDMYDDEDYVKSLLSFCAKVTRKFAQYYIEAGMDVIAVVDPLISQISPECFENFMSEPFSGIFDYIRTKKSLSSFFVCGNATRNIELMCLTRPDCIAVDENVSMSFAKNITDKYNIVLEGNIPLTTIMLFGSQQDNMKYVADMLSELNNGNLIVSPGCDMPYHTPVENVIAAAHAVRETDKVRMMIADYQSEELDDNEIAIPDYANLLKPLIEVFTLDSQSCAACAYMMDAVVVAHSEFGGKIDVVEYKYTVKENIVRCKKMGVKNLPSIYINGQLVYSSIIPNKEELADNIRKAFK